MRQQAGGVVVAVKAVPGASRDRVVGVLGDCLKIATSTAAEKGKANRALAAALADVLGVSPKSVELVSGPTSPRKEFLVTGLSADEARRRLTEA
ncbi:MAG TPA: hypothetical protein DCX07_04440 [Phycisphaerales bacterium]|nr:hypothetical protein [Phycisphaerales bacterium]